jgi:hypothetical protein
MASESAEQSNRGRWSDAVQGNALRNLVDLAHHKMTSFVATKTI